MSVLIHRILSATLKNCSIKNLPKFRSIVFNNSIAQQFYYGKMSAVLPQIIFVLGAPGAGKGNLYSTNAIK